MQELITSAIERACRFLRAAQEPDGFWRDYALPPGPSSEWVTAVVGNALARVGYPFSQNECLTRALSAMRSSCRKSGWGYSAAVATDADTTSWGVRLFLRTNTALPIQPVACLKAYLSSEGGARTFVCDPRYGRWTDPHADVTAVLGLALKEAGVQNVELQAMRTWALDQRNERGLWTAFWWTFDAYPTARMLEFLAATGGVPSDVVDASRRYLETKTDATTPMEIANLLIMASRVRVSAEAWISSLLARQRGIGSWPPSRVLKVPDQRKGSDEHGEAFEDMNGFMSTAMALIALTECLRGDCDQA